MTWEELKQKAKEMGSEIVKGTAGDLTYEVIIFNNFRFYRDGEIMYPNFMPIDDRFFISKDRTPDQMYSIMKALQ